MIKYNDTIDRQSERSRRKTSHFRFQEESTIDYNKMNSNTGYIMTVANSIIGVGILAMPFCFMKVFLYSNVLFMHSHALFTLLKLLLYFQCGILLSILLLVVSNLVTRIACHYLLKTSIKARRKNFEFLGIFKLQMFKSILKHFRI